MDFMTAVKTCFNKYTTFRGRASRSEFWYFTLVLVLGELVTGLIDAMLYPDNPFSPINSIFALLTILPYLAVTSRRLHDIDRLGWWILLGAIPLIGAIVLIVWFCQAGDRDANRFGADPLSGTIPV